ncbi:MAG: glycosyltransferase, partial [Acidimicrobiaceae bacterium]|nr:glycosyltransferase [Acidimicrobiaceae bacterium]
VSAVEGLACGLPVILGRTGATSEVLEEGVQGYYVEPGDGEALAAALEGMISRLSLRRQMGEAGRSLAERRYDARSITTRLIGWMLELADRPPGGDGLSTRP